MGLRGSTAAFWGSEVAACKSLAERTSRQVRLYDFDSLSLLPGGFFAEKYKAVEIL